MASTSNQIDSSTSSFSPRWNVFLSFRGEDTRRNFTGHLYKALDRVGIQTFMDDSELPRGEEISPVLLKAIQESKISIVVISKNYASSAWCLNELVKILECRKRMGQLVLPVFYNVNPSDVRTQCGSFAEAFEKHKIHFVGDMDKVEKWQVTLTEAAQLSGYHLDANKDEADLIEKIVDRVQVEVNPIYLNVAKEPVGIASHVKNIMPLLSIGTNDVRKIGIYGMGGVGKTTVAKAVYNENCHFFQGSCFLANVREVSGQPNGIVRLQEQLVSEVMKLKKFTITNVDKGISLIEDKIRFKKVLIVLDDLDHLNQLHSLAGQWNRFASGSIIMITTRDALLLDQIQVDRRYMVEELNNNDSLELFSRHAFGKTIPLKDFMEVSQEIIGYACGLPLALEVFGSNLSNQTMLAWRRFIKKLQQVPNHEIHEKLMISFDTLADVDLKDIFLDIACFFIGKEKEEATTILSACYDFVENDISILEKRCLLKINKKNELRMHDLLRDMGREIVRKKSPKEAEKHSRLWCSADICDVLNKDKGTESIEGIVPYDGELDQVTLNTKTFERMRRLRLLDIRNVHLTGSFEHIFGELRWLCWRRCSLECLPSDFHPEKLVILDLFSSKINMLCNGNLFLEQLKILDLRDCEFLKTTADISGLASLEKLLLSGCKRLVEVHPSIGRLGKLVFLDLRYCTKLTFLPSSICNLRALESLNICHCISLKELPEELGDIQRLKKLLASYSGIRKIPDSIGRLSRLVHLDFGSCKDLGILTSKVCNLRELEDLYVNGCSNLKGLPKELGNIESIRVLRAGYIPIKKLPDLIGLLRNLFELNLSGCWDLINLPSSIGQLRGLERLILLGCSNLECLPDLIGQLSKLVELNLCDCVDLRDLPSSICNLRALKRLNLNGCSSLERLPQDLGNIESLEFLWAKDTTIIELPDSIGRLTKLLELYLYNCMNLRNLPSSICNLRALEKLNIDGCSNLEGLPEELGKMESLRELHGGSIHLNKIPDSIGDMKNLRVLNLRSACRLNLDLVLHPPFTRFVPPSITGLCSLNSLDLSNCDLFDEDIPDNIGSLSSLETLNLSGNHFSSLPSSLVQLSKLRRFYLKRCKRLRSLPGIPSNLCVLYTRDCISLERLPNLSNLEEGRKRKWRSTVATF